MVGDYVWAWDEETGEKSLRRVTETYVNQTSELVHVFVGGEEIITTPTHPFYSPVKGWTDAAQLRAGDILVLVNGEYVVVEKVQHEILESPINVYNFQVAGDHTYYVSDIGVLVHNMCAAENGAFNNKRIISNGKVKGHKFTMDLENAATGPQIHIQTGKGARHKYIFDGVSDFVNSSGESIASAIKNSRIVQDGLTKARYLIEKGWPWR